MSASEYCHSGWRLLALLSQWKEYSGSFRGSRALMRNLISLIPRRTNPSVISKSRVCNFSKSSSLATLPHRSHRSRSLGISLAPKIPQEAKDFGRCGCLHLRHSVVWRAAAATESGAAAAIPPLTEVLAVGCLGTRGSMGNWGLAVFLTCVLSFSQNGTRLVAQQ